MLILRVLQSGIAAWLRHRPAHSRALQRSAGVEEGLLYPTLQKMLVKGWVTAEWGISETNRKVRFYRTDSGRPQALKAELSGV